MWFEILPAALIIATALYVPSIISARMHDWVLGNRYLRTMDTRYQRKMYQRDGRFGDPYNGNGLEAIPDDEEEPDRSGKPEPISSARWFYKGTDRTPRNDEDGDGSDPGYIRVETGKRGPSLKDEEKEEEFIRAMKEAESKDKIFLQDSPKDKDQSQDIVNAKDFLKDPSSIREASSDKSLIRAVISGVSIDSEKSGEECTSSPSSTSSVLSSPSNSDASLSSVPSVSSSSSEDSISSKEP